MKSLSNWSRNFLSTAGKEILIKSVAQEIPADTMSVLRLLATLYKEMMSAIFNFWRNGGHKAKIVHWIRRDELVKPKSLGGLGYRDMISFNSALLAK